MNLEFTAPFIWEKCKFSDFHLQGSLLDDQNFLKNQANHNMTMQTFC